MKDAKMNPETLAALRGSIKKWEKIVAGTGKDNGEKNCPLCRIFWDGNPGCHGCPVQKKTRQAECYGTPYQEFSAFADYDIDGYGVAKSPAAKAAARKELSFLKSLLPQPTRRKAKAK